MKIEAMKITLHEMRFYAYHGVFPQEQRVGNQFVVELTFWADVAGSVRSDELEETISYADVYEVVKAEMDIPSRILEHVVGRISERLFATFPVCSASHSPSASAIRPSLARYSPQPSPSKPAATKPPRLGYLDAKHGSAPAISLGRSRILSAPYKRKRRYTS